MTAISIKPGDVFVSKRSKSGRRWSVLTDAGRDGTYCLYPLGVDVRSARSGRTGKWQGGVRNIVRSAEQIEKNFKRVL